MQIDTKDFIVNNNSIDTKFFTLIGNHDFIDDNGNPRTTVENHNTFAKAIKNRISRNIIGSNYSYKYFICTDANLNILNPVELYSDANSINNTTKYIDKICKSEKRFTEVNESIFNKYIAFLTTKNISSLNSAQRDLK